MTSPTPAADEITVRLHVSGLTPSNVSPADLQSRFSTFGHVEKISRWPPPLNAVEQPQHFAYVTIRSAPEKIKRCMNLLSGTTWKGSKIRVAEAKRDWKGSWGDDDGNLVALSRSDKKESEEKVKKRKRSRTAPRQQVTVTRGDIITEQDVKDGKVWGWRLTPAGHLLRPMQMRPSHPIPAVVKKGDAVAVRRNTAPPNRARNQIIDPARYGAVHVGEAMLGDADVEGHGEVWVCEDDEELEGRVRWVRRNGTDVVQTEDVVVGTSRRPEQAQREHEAGESDAQQQQPEVQPSLQSKAQQAKQPTASQETTQQHLTHNVPQPHASTSKLSVSPPPSTGTFKLQPYDPEEEDAFSDGYAEGDVAAPVKKSKSAILAEQNARRDKDLELLRSMFGSEGVERTRKERVESVQAVLDSDSEEEEEVTVAAPVAPPARKQESPPIEPDSSSDSESESESGAWWIRSLQGKASQSARDKERKSLFDDDDAVKERQSLFDDGNDDAMDVQQVASPALSPSPSSSAEVEQSTQTPVQEDGAGDSSSDDSDDEEEGDAHAVEAVNDTAAQVDVDSDSEDEETTTDKQLEEVAQDVDRESSSSSSDDAQEAASTQTQEQVQAVPVDVDASDSSDSDSEDSSDDSSSSSEEDDDMLAHAEQGKPVTVDASSDSDSDDDSSSSSSSGSSSDEDEDVTPAVQQEQQPNSTEPTPAPGQHDVDMSEASPAEPTTKPTRGALLRAALSARQTQNTTTPQTGFLPVSRFEPGKVEETQPVEAQVPPVPQSMPTPAAPGVEVHMSSLKEMFRPQESANGLSSGIFGDSWLGDEELDLDVAVEEEVDDVPVPVQAPVPTSEPQAQPSQPTYFFFPSTSSRSPLQGLLSGCTPLTPDSPAELQAKWEERKSVLTQDYRRRHREAVKKRKRGVVVVGGSGGGSGGKEAHLNRVRGRERDASESVVRTPVHVGQGANAVQVGTRRWGAAA